MATVDVSTVIKYEGWGTAPPSIGAFNVSDKVWNLETTSGGFIGWVCTTAGSPGTWKTFGAVS